MELQTVRMVSKEYGVSTRMLRYYEQNGLIKSMKKDDYSYRVYDTANIERLQQVIILRKLQIPIKQICTILNNPDAATAVEIFKKSIHELDTEITALSTIKIILNKFINRLEALIDLKLTFDTIKDDSVLTLIHPFSFIQRNIREAITMSDLMQAADVLSKLENIRVVYVPPMTVASIFCTGENSEERAWKTITDFAKQSDLIKIKPDLRVFKIAHLNATGNSFGDEAWVSIPESLTVPSTFAKKKFLGGQYAAHVMDENNNFEIGLGMQDWINESDKYQYDYNGNLSRCDPPIKEIDSFGGMHLDLLEVLNFTSFQKPGYEIQIDYLTPIKDYILSEEISEEIFVSKEKCGFKTSIVTKNKFRIMGFSKIMSGDASTDGFFDEIRNDGRLSLINKHRKPGAPILEFGSIDMDSQRKGGWRCTFCLAESDITDVQAFMKHNPYIEKIDASRWLIFEYEKVDAFDDHAACQKLGYTWNGVISGVFTTVSPTETKVYCWYPVK